MSSKHSPRKSQACEVKGQTLSPKQPGTSTPREPGSSRSSKSTSPAEVDAVDQVMTINRHLLTHIETLKLKLDVNERNHTHSMNSVIRDGESKVKTRELEIENLKADIGKKEQTIKNFAQTNKEKQVEIGQLQNYIDNLKEDVRVSKAHADDIQQNLDALRLEKAKLETGDAYSDKDTEIQRLQSEIDNLRKNLSDLERELVQAKRTISVQGGKLRQADLDRTNVQVRFKEELAKVSINMRKEVEKIRDVMKMQWNEMKELREQNLDMRSDLREIKELLVSEIQTSHRSSPSSPTPIRPAPLSLPGLKRENSRLVSSRKKR